MIYDLDDVRAADPTATDEEIAAVLLAWADRAHAMAAPMPCWSLRAFELFDRRDVYHRTALALTTSGP